MEIRQMFRTRGMRLTIATITLCSSLWAPAAEVPPGVKLAPIQHLVRGNGAEVESLDPHKTTGMPEANIMHDLLEGLVSFNIQGKIVPGVAKTWQCSSDQKQWTFRLRPEAKWSNGEPVQAKDFVYAWRRLADPQTASPYSSYLHEMRLQNSAEVIAGRQSIEQLGISAVDAYTLQLTLSQPIAHLLKMLAHQVLKPVHRATLEKHGDRWTQPGNYVGNGAYQLEKWVVNEYINLIRNQRYWDNRKTVIDQVKYLPLNSQEEVERYRSGEIDMIYGDVPPSAFKRLQRELPDHIQKIPSMATYYYVFNMRKPPFNNKKVRKALALTIDKKYLVETVKGGWSTIAHNFTPASCDIPTAVPDWASWPHSKRVNLAKQLLHEAGYNKNKPLKFSLTYGNNTEENARLATAISLQWKKVLGIEVTLEGKEWKNYLEDLASGNFQMARRSWIGDYYDPTAFLNQLLPTNSGNRFGYQNARFTTLLKQALSESDELKRKSYYQQAEAQLTQDNPIIPLYHNVMARLIQPYVKGYSVKNPMKIVHTKDIYLVQQ